MTNEQAKQEAIRKAYGKHYELLENFINSEGKVFRAMCPDNTQNIFGNIFWDNLNGSWWPKSLKGIEDNNGWIRIEPDGSNLPVGVNTLIVIDKSGDTFESVFSNDYLLKKCTHYRFPLELPKPVY